MPDLGRCLARGSWDKERFRIGGVAELDRGRCVDGVLPDRQGGPARLVNLVRVDRAGAYMEGVRD